ncbi:hypothetical protein A3H89_01310 [Candidatus Amesbacteria bacterium RIFCSPLOWO2_02_FULL_48_11]|uniref:Bacterial Ig-like domain-containing protein n=1 Tax=Candidatus Amesbacteria bacterium RIFCSPHIGHO2_12_FULL_48_14 TaxID=1797257 RepID=A0A1F4Z867_9BACT|nr:MAG: hypothetical protein A2V48_01295 [Candidatus Amesbacteria bacterium RBG_19FT_COMBO_48_16]OGC97250.1 MAG: hypothetical protein A3C34_04395 [Candidatus Amesbacteria bacterium RIFCSPHIGHO2_02_FULL_48_21]OGC99193.1 MAG: hypothetical protein A2702_01505 [Candidatus Amesbacteria bacterium RIFCSPHIGHO2_01_FULL_48_75]OGC99277.1 MAG: hypothetical protein A2W16_02665 [Candidatus Amesbacteria bacterium RBG_16_48_31]OGD02146.1 MAG: hypothetical protein A3E17_03485 [Candidatus Amesbacteria bacterium
MAIRILLVLFVLLVFASASPARTSASAYQLTAVGSLNTTGATFRHLWYTNGTLTFSGIAPAGETVTATIDGSAATAVADASGNWSHPVSLSEGDHTVVFAAGGSNFADFTLTIGPAPEGIGELKTSDTPTAGAVAPTLAFLSLGFLLTTSGLFLHRRLA